MPQRIQVRSGSKAQWTAANPVLAAGEIGAEIETGYMKVGDGVTTWNNKPYSGVGPTTSQIIAADGRTLQQVLDYLLGSNTGTISTPTVYTFGNLPYRVGFYPWDPTTSSASQNNQFLDDTDEWKRIMGIKPGSKNLFVDWTQDIGNWAGDAYYKLLASKLTGPNYIGTDTGIIPELGIGMINHQMGLDQFMTEIIAGQHNDIFYGIALNAAQSGYPVCHFRPGYEFNGGFMPWSPANSGDANRFTNFIGAFRVIYTQIQAAYTFARANGFPNAIGKVVWNPTSINYSSGNIVIENLYPGDAYVDVVGIDVYGKMYPRDLTDWRTGNTTMSNFAAWSAVKENLWHYYSWNDCTMGSPHGDGGGCSFERLVDFAIAHNKPFSIPECGCGNNDINVGPLDNFQFVDWLKDALDRAIARGATILNLNSWCTDQGDGGWGYMFGQRPLAAARWNANFGLPVDHSGNWELAFRGTQYVNYCYLPGSDTNAAMHPGSNSFRLETRVKLRSLGTNQLLLSSWSETETGKQNFFFARDGFRLNMTWKTSAGIATAMSTVDDHMRTNLDVTYAVDVNPVSGAVTFWRSFDDVTYVQQGATVTATNAGAVLVSSTTVSLSVGQNDGGQRPFKGTVSRVKVVINGTTVCNSSVSYYGMHDAVTNQDWGRGSVTIIRNVPAVPYTSPAVATTLATDDFEGVTQNPAAGKWQQLFDAAPTQIIGGYMTGTDVNVGNFSLRTMSEAYTSNQFSEFTVLDSQDGNAGPMVGGIDYNAQGYWVTCSNGNWTLQSLNNGYFSLATLSHPAPVNGDKIAIRKVFVSGTSGSMDIIVSINDYDVMHYVDSSPVVGGQPAVYFYNVNVKYGSWRGGSSDKPWTPGPQVGVRGSFGS